MADLTPPFDGDFAEVLVTRPINLAQLATEIKQAVSGSPSIAMLGPDQPQSAISADNPAHLYVSPPPTAGVIDTVLAAHTPNANWGSSSRDAAFNAAWAKVQADPAYSPTSEETQALVVGLAYRVMGGQG